MKSSVYIKLWPDEVNASIDSGNPNYNAFISGLLSNPSTTKEDRERIVGLLLKERDKGFVTEEQVVQIIRRYTGSEDSKGKVNQIKSADTINNDSSVDDIKYKSPKDTHDFLVAYNQDSILKYTCHNIDDEDVINEINKECGVAEYDYDKHLQIIQDHFNLLKKGRYIHYRILNLISAYLTGKTIKGDASEWSSSNVQENWASVQLKEWAGNNPHVVPNPDDNIASKYRNSGYKLTKPYKSSLTGLPITKFSQSVLYFKSLFHIKEDNSLKSIIEYVNKVENYKERNIDITFDEGFLEKTELFAYVDALVQAYKAIIKICSNYANNSGLGNPQIKLSFYEDTDKKCFCIHHINTVYGKTKNDAVSRIGESQMRLIKSHINGLCDLYIQASFKDDSSYEINLWNGEDRLYNKIDDIQGVKYIMKFYI